MGGGGRGWTPLPTRATWNPAGWKGRGGDGGGGRGVICKGSIGAKDVLRRVLRSRGGGVKEEGKKEDEEENEEEGEKDDGKRKGDKGREKEEEMRIRWEGEDWGEETRGERGGGGEGIGGGGGRRRRAVYQDHLVAIPLLPFGTQTLVLLFRVFGFKHVCQLFQRKLRQCL